MPPIYRPRSKRVVLRLCRSAQSQLRQKLANRVTPKLAPKFCPMSFRTTSRPQTKIKTMLAWVLPVDRTKKLLFLLRREIGAAHSCRRALTDVGCAGEPGLELIGLKDHRHAVVQLHNWFASVTIIAQDLDLPAQQQAIAGFHMRPSIRVQSR